MAYTIATLNQMDQTAFVAVLGDVFEHTPAIAAQAWNHRPFQDVDDLHQTMVNVMNNLTLEEKLTLMRSHPDLGSRVQMAIASVKEQAGVGLDRLSPEEYQQFQQLNQAYREKFGFPFIIAVRHHTIATILEAFSQRLQNAIDIEIEQTLSEIAKITKFRLLDILD
jgi:2-oxo-4-hydroxy-4-carboxy-5-ureidoimidazoline decarboxylase